MLDLKFKLQSIEDDLTSVKKIWEHNYNASRDGFFLSPSWIYEWLSHLPREASPQLLVLEDDSRTYFATILGKLKSKGMFLNYTVGWFNETGVEAFDDLVIENNGFVGDGESKRILSSWKSLLNDVGVDQLKVNNISEQRLSELNELLPLNGCISYVSCLPSYYVCLKKARAESDGYLALLSANKRRQIKRSLKYYKSIELQEPGSQEQALEMFDELVALHQKEWEQRGKPGTFSNSFVYNFHRELVQQVNTKQKKVKIYRFTSSGNTIGVIYGFISDGVFSYYQSGFMYADDNKAKPGLNCHAILINHLSEQGIDKYDFLAGGAEYKKSLGTDYYNMCSMEVFQNSFKNKVYLGLRGAKRLAVRMLD